MVNYLFYLNQGLLKNSLINHLNTVEPTDTG